MMQVKGNETPQAETRYETPTFDPRGAFSWTLRAGERARLEARRQRAAADQRSSELQRV